MHTTPDSAPHSLLLIDDEPDNLKVLILFLQDYQFTVFTATNGPMGLELARQRQPSLILLDISMPLMDGFEVCAQLKQDPRTATIPVVFFSLFDREEEKVRGFSLGAVDYITKPVRQGELLARVTAHLNQQRLYHNLLQRLRAYQTHYGHLPGETSADRDLPAQHLQQVQRDGGDTWTMLPGVGSAAIDAGGDQSAVITNSDDQRGSTRPVGAAWDIGAVEVNPPTAPTGLSATPSASVVEVALTWADNAITETSYKLMRGTTAGGPYAQVGFDLPADSTTVTDTDPTLACGTTYYYVVGAFNADGGSASNEVSATTLACPALPESPTGVGVALVNSVPQVSWSAPAAGGTPSGYKVKRSTSATGPFTEVGTALTSPHDDASATCGTTHYYVVASTNAAGDSADSAPAVSVTTVACPVATLTAPATLDAVPNGNSIDLTWAAVTGASGYTLYRATSAAGPWDAPLSFITNLSQLSYTDTTNLECGVTYYYGAEATNGGAMSSVASATAACVVPVAVSGVNANPIAPDSVNLSWTHSGDNVTGFRVYRDGNLVADLSAPASAYGDSGLACGNYSYTVIAYNSTGDAPTSNLATVNLSCATDATLQVSSTGLGRITSQPAGIDCGSVCSAAFAVGSVVTLSAVPDTGYVFAGWNDPACGAAMTLNSGVACAATFATAPSGTPGIGGVTPSVGGLSEVAPGVVSASVSEDAGSVSIRFSRGAGSAGVIVLAYTSVDGSATAGSDYLPVSGSLTWADGDSGDKTINLTLLDDSEYEGSESLQLQFSVVSGNFSLGHTHLQLLIVDNDTQAVACPPNSGALHLGSGQAIASAACFNHQVNSGFNRSGNGLMVLQNEAVNLGVQITADPGHVGQAAKLLLLVSYQHAGHTVWLTRAGSIWRFWREGESLPAAQDLAALPETLEVPVYSGLLSGLPGVFTVYAGYLLNDGSLVHNLPQPLRVTVANALVAATDGSQTPAYAYFNSTSGDLYQYGNPHRTVVNWVLTSYLHLHTPALLAAEVAGGPVRQEVSPNDFVVVPTGYTAEVYAVRRFVAPSRLEYVTRLSNQAWAQWFPETDPLFPMASLNLGQARTFTLYHGVLPSVGEYTGYVGYRLPDGRIVYNGLDLLRVNVE